MKIVIGNKNYSSWSMRPWLALQHAGAQFEEILVPLDAADTAANIAKHSRAGRLPILLDGDLTIWDSLAICEYLAEKFPAAKLWPEDAKARATARSICAEMHSGFVALRTDCTMKIRARYPARPLRDEVKADLARLSEIWSQTRERFGQGGPYLFGGFSNADAFFGPVAARVKTYALPVEGVAAAYVDALWASPPVRAWVAGAERETLIVPRYEQQA